MTSTDLTPPPVVAPRLGRGASRARSSEIRDLLAVIDQPGVLSLAGGLPAADAIPAERIAAAIDRALARPGRYGALALQYGPTAGIDDLHALVTAGTAAYPPPPDGTGIVVTTGSQQGLDLVARTLLDPGDVVAVEDPLYLGARQAFTAHGVRLVGITTDGEGLDPAHLVDLLAGGLRPRAVYCVPNFSNPSGASLPAERRAALAALAQRYGFVIIEDDPYRPLHFGAPAVAPIAELAPEHTVFLGSTSKFVAPGLRVGWLAGPRWLRDAAITAKQGIDLHTPALNQLVVADVLGDDAFLGHHLERLRSRLATRATTLHATLIDVVRADRPAGGMFLWGRVPIPARDLLPRAVAAGVAFVPGPAFAVKAGDHADAVRLSFATLDDAELRVAADRLRTAVAIGS